MNNQKNDNENKSIIEKNILSLFTDSKFQIPLYQRSFVWSNKEVNQLLEDLYNYFTEESNKNYFLGTLIVNNRNDNNEEVEVIDGQQRITVLFLLLLVIIKKQKNETLTDDDVNKIKEHFPKFEARNISVNTFEYLIDLNADTATDSDNFDSNIINAYNIIIDYVTNKDDFVQKFLTNKEKIVVYIITVPQHTDLHRYFETMNNRGKQLSQTDIIKERLLGYFVKDKNQKQEYLLSILSDIWDACSDMNQYFQKNLDVISKKYCIKEGDEENKFSAREVVFGKEWNSPIQEWEVLTQFDIDHKSTENSKDSVDTNQNIFEIIKEYNDSLKKYESDKDEFEDEDGNKVKFNSIIRFEHFLLYVLRLLNIEIVSFNEKKLIDTFNNNLFNEDQDQEKIKTFFLTLIKARFLFDNYIIKRQMEKGASQTETEKWCIKKTIEEKKSVIKNTFNDEKNDLLVKIQSCLHVSYQTPSNNDWLFKCLKWLFDNSSNIQLNEFIEENEKYACKKISDYIDKEEAYKNGTSTAHIVFNYLDYLIYKNKDNKDLLGLYSDTLLKEIDFNNFSFSTARNSIEHWYPQNPGQDTNLEKINVIAKLNDFGNLALVTTSINSRNGNRPPLSKKKDLESFNQNGNFSLKLQIMMALTNEDCCWMSNDNNDKNQMYCCHSKNMQDILSTALKEMSNTKDKH